MEYVLHYIQAMKVHTAGFFLIPLLTALAVGCGEKERPAQNAAPDEAEPVAVAPPTPTDDAPTQGTSGRHREDGDWIPAEYKSGKGRWKDAAAYVDGVPVGMFWFGELPSTLEPVWIEEIEGLDFKPGDPPPYERVIKVRRYRFSDYFEAVGVQLDKIKELHIYGPNSQILVVTGEEFMRVKDYFYFRFGLGTHGKAIAVIPKDLGRNFDRLMGAAVYIEKEPPTLTEDEDENMVLVLDGKPVEGIPYFGEPLRGGIRIYKDDRLTGIIKRNKLDPDSGEKGADGQPRWKLFDTLEFLRIETADIVQAEVIYDERRTVRFDRSELESMTFRSSAQGRGQLELDDKTPAHGLALYSKPLPKKVVSSRPGGEATKTP